MYLSNLMHFDEKLLRNKSIKKKEEEEEENYIDEFIFCLFFDKKNGLHVFQLI